MPILCFCICVDRRFHAHHNIAVKLAEAGDARVSQKQLQKGKRGYIDFTLPIQKSNMQQITCRTCRGHDQRNHRQMKLTFACDVHETDKHTLHQMCRSAHLPIPFRYHAALGHPASPWLPPLLVPPLPCLPACPASHPFWISVLTCIKCHKADWLAMKCIRLSH